MEIKKDSDFSEPFSFLILDCTVYLAGTNATGAHIQTGNLTIYHSTNALNVWFPSSFGFSVGVTDVESSSNPFIANLTKVCHEIHLLACLAFFATQQGNDSIDIFKTQYKSLKSLVIPVEKPYYGVWRDMIGKECG